MGTQPVGVARAEQVTTEQPERLGAEIDHRVGVVGRADRGHLVSQPGDFERVHRPGIDGERVAHLAPNDEARITQRLAEPRDLRLHRVRARDHRVVGPQILDQALLGHHRPGRDGQPHEQLGRLPGRYGDELAVPADLDRPEHRNRDHLRRLDGPG
jgi:hypothetical protein